MAFPRMPQNVSKNDEAEDGNMLSQSDGNDACIDDEDEGAGHNFANAGFGAAGSRRVSTKV